MMWLDTLREEGTWLALLPIGMLIGGSVVAAWLLLKRDNPWAVHVAEQVAWHDHVQSALWTARRTPEDEATGLPPSDMYLVAWCDLYGEDGWCVVDTAVQAAEIYGEMVRELDSGTITIAVPVRSTDYARAI